MFQFNETTLNEFRAIVKRYPADKSKSALIPALHLAQRENNGYLNSAAMNYVADLLGLKHVEAYDTATFYSMFNMKPVGKYVIEYCRTGPCAISGGEAILEYLKSKLGIKEEETTPDGLFTLKMMECLGGCGYAPLFQIGPIFYQNLTEEKVDALLADCRAGKIPTTVEAFQSMPTS
jgi:NADH-quinone oxidoreductase subunit E